MSSIPSENAPAVVRPLEWLLQQQLVKFCIVGGTSTVIDKGIFWLLMKRLAPQLPWFLSATISFCLGVTNGFIWNRRWTFQSHETSSIAQQYPKFLASNIVGLVLNLAITKVFLMIFTGQAIHPGHNPDATKALIASLCATPFVVFWNFFASKHWTFRAAQPAL